MVMNPDTSPSVNPFIYTTVYIGVVPSVLRIAPLARVGLAISEGLPEVVISTAKKASEYSL